MFTNAASLLVAAAVLAAGGALPAWKHVQAQTAVTDFDGISYRTVTIGRQAWMAENVRSTRACDGTPVAHDAHPGGQDLVNTYGRLYTEAAARMGEPAGSDRPSGVRGICPCGWHLPSDGEATVRRRAGRPLVRRGQAEGTRHRPVEAPQRGSDR